MPEFEVDHSDESDLDGSSHLVDWDFGVPVMRTPGVKKALGGTNEKLIRSTRENNVVIWFGYNDYMAYHYAFMVKVATVGEPEIFYEAPKDPRWVEAMNEEMQALSKN